MLLGAALDKFLIGLEGIFYYCPILPNVEVTNPVWNDSNSTAVPSLLGYFVFEFSCATPIVNNHQNMSNISLGLWCWQLLKSNDFTQVFMFILMSAITLYVKFPIFWNFTYFSGKSYSQLKVNNLNFLYPS